MSAFADLADAATRSSVGHLFRQLLLATPKTRGLTMTIVHYLTLQVDFPER